MKLGKIIFKKLSGNTSEKEELLFLEWYHSTKRNKVIFSRLKEMKENGYDISVLLTLNSEKAWSKVLNKSTVSNAKVKKVWFSRAMLKYAAMFIGVLGLGYGYYWTQTSFNAHNSTHFNTNSITLQLSDGSIKEISLTQPQTIIDANGNHIITNQDNNVLDYSNVTKAKDIAYNTLNVPYGKRFKIILSDSSIVHLNAGTSIKYPVKFINGKNRKVFLSGEAFFEVSKDKENPFIVSSGNLNVRVLGTKFNISAYKEDLKINTVLVEGSVSLYSSDHLFKEKQSTLLEPGFKAAWDTKGKVGIEKVDTEIYISWVDGKLIFRKTLFKDIIIKLERHFNVSIKNNFKELDLQMFTATFDKESIIDALDSFKESTPFNYEINGREIVISQPIKNHKI
ncbi:FecR family protein [Flavobacteriaceae bacterium LMO-SS05]